jgi:uncharacterized protein (TIGR02722 family)
MKHLKKTCMFFVLSTYVLMTGCATRSPSVGGNVVYGDTKEVEALTNEFGLTDLQQLAESMTNSMLTSPFILESNQKPTITIQEVRNKTSEHIDTKSITNKIRVKLQKSQAIRFLSDAIDENGALSELQRQGQSGRYAQSKTARMGKAEGAKYRMFGEITSIVKRAGDIKNIDYTLTLQVEDLTTSEIVWTDEKEIRKTSERSMF